MLINDKVYLNGLLAIAITVTALSLYMSHSTKVGIAKAALDYAYNSIVIGDYRTTINILDKNIPDNFQYISLKNSYTDVTNLGTKPKFNVTVKLNVVEGPAGSNVGEVSFYYNPMFDLLRAVLATLLVLSIYSFIFFRELLSQEKKLEMQNKIVKLNADNEMALQVSHDIRSPLTALNVVASKLKAENGELAHLLTMASSRINEIASQLLIKSRETSVTTILVVQKGAPKPDEIQSQVTFFNLNRAISDLILEKNLILSTTTKISLQLEETIELLVKFSKTELLGVLSNLINNSIESLIDQSGLIQVISRKYSRHFLIIVQDNGRGISEDKLYTLGSKGVSYGKENSETAGSGLGIYQAKKFMESVNGKFEILSKEEMGTMITLHFPVETTSQPVP